MNHGEVNMDVTKSAIDKAMKQSDSTNMLFLITSSVVRQATNLT